MAKESIPRPTIQGNPISLGKATKRYGVPQPTLSRWAKAGELIILKRPEKRGQPLLVDEASIVIAIENHLRKWLLRWERAEREMRRK